MSTVVPLQQQTLHRVYERDSRDLSPMKSGSVHLVCTSPPYASLIHYSDRSDQLGNIECYELFLTELDKVWAECFRLLVPGGRIACVVGDVCLSRKQAGRHHVLPLSADIQVRMRKLGFDCLTPIRWLKVSNIKMEASSSSRFLGKPNLPNGIIKNDLEHILFFRKPGGYRSPSERMNHESFIPTEEYMKMFSPIWSDIKGQRRKDHPAPYPAELARRIVKMFSFVGDTVLDPFGGTGSTAAAALLERRNSITVDIEPDYVDAIISRLETCEGGPSKIQAYRPQEVNISEEACVA
ncbi:MAG: site-specific DNA-methyltransferase [Pseudomonadota bacterium]